MPIVQVPNTDLRYYLIAFDKDGVERSDDPAGTMSELIVAELRRRPVSDVFILNHGWMGDLPDAESQYNAWFGTLFADRAGRALLEQRRGQLEPLLIGIHWPSKPFGDEQFAGGAFSAGEVEDEALPITTEDVPLTVDDLTAAYADKFADPARADAALRTIFEHMRDEATPYELTPELRAAFVELNAATGLGDGGEADARPGDDREPFDADTIYYAVSDEASFGQIGGGLLQAVGLVSFWQMKGRAAAIGESGANDLLRSIAAARPEARLHLVGHSFGCIVVSAMIASKPGAGAPIPVHSATLVQGALSCWTYGAALPEAAGKAGYFHRVVRDGLVRGPLLAVHSRADHAVGRLYPAAAGVAGQHGFDTPEPKKYSALGAFGAQLAHAASLELPPLTAAYSFKPGKVYNLDGTAYIKKGNFFVGGHNDIYHLELSRAIWTAAAADAVGD